MNKYKIITDGHKYRVQKRFKLGPVSIWTNEHIYEVADVYPKVRNSTLEFDTLEEAEAYVHEHIVERDSPRKKRWKTVRKFSDVTHSTRKANCGEVLSNS